VTLSFGDIVSISLITNYFLSSKYTNVINVTKTQCYLNIFPLTAPLCDRSCQPPTITCLKYTSNIIHHKHHLWLPK